MANDRLHDIRKWALYYGDQNPLGLGRYDLAVIAPEAWPAEAVARLRQQGTRVLGYLSVLEVPKREGEAPRAVLRIGGRPVEQTLWNTWILDPRLPETAERMHRRARELAGRFDGLFLDTVGDVESAHIPPAQRSLLLPATARLVASLRERLPQTIMVQNWGLGALLDLTMPYLDAVCWEDFPVGPPQGWQQDLSTRLQWVRSQGVQVLALSGKASASGAQLAEKLGFPWYGAPGSYIEWAKEA